MAISIKTSEDIEKMRVAGRLAAEVLEMIEPYVKPGVSTGEAMAELTEALRQAQMQVEAGAGYGADAQRAEHPGVGLVQPAPEYCQQSASGEQAG